MIDFGAVQKFIYFPRPHERQGDPYVIYVLDKWGEEWRGNPDPAELLQRQFSTYLIARCQPYSEELWARCQDWIDRRTALNEEFEQLMKRGVNG